MTPENPLLALRVKDQCTLDEKLLALLAERRATGRRSGQSQARVPSAGARYRSRT